MRQQSDSLHRHNPQRWVSHCQLQANKLTNKIRMLDKLTILIHEPVSSSLYVLQFHSNFKEKGACGFISPMFF